MTSSANLSGYRLIQTIVVNEHISGYILNALAGVSVIPILCKTRIYDRLSPRGHVS